MNYQIIRHEHIFQAGTGFAQCHASTLCRLPDGHLAAAWFGGDHEKAPNVAIWFSRLLDGQWTTPVKIADCTDTPCWNPVLFVHHDRTLLFYKTGNEIIHWQTMVKESFDSGLTWTTERELVPGDVGGRGPVKNKCIHLHDGSILAPSSTEENGWNCFTDRSEDGGLTWTRSANVPPEESSFSITADGPRGMIQPTLWEDDQELVHMLMRSTEGNIFRSDSADGGRSWSAAKRTELPNNNCGIDLVRMENGHLVLVYNPVSGNWAARSPIAFAVSDDNAATWSRPQILDHVPCDHNTPEAEFSYPAIIAEGSDIFITYTWKRRNIAFWQIRFPD